MNLFFSPPVRTYSLLLQHHQAPPTVDALISTGFVQFQLSPYDNPHDPFYIVESRIRHLKHRLNSTIQHIQTKYGTEGLKLIQQDIQLTQKDKQLTIGRMKDYIEQRQIDYLRYKNI